MKKILINTINGLIQLIAVFTFTFILFNIAPGNPARIILGPSAPESAVKELEKELNLDKPLHIQFITELSSIFKLNFGKSLQLEKPVIKLVLNRAKLTFTLVIIALALAISISYILNLLGYLYPQIKPALNISKAGVALPAFVLSILSAVFISFAFPQLPMHYAPENPKTLILPSLIISLYPTAMMTEITLTKINQNMQSTLFKSTLALGISKLRAFHNVLLETSLVSIIAGWINILTVAFFSTLVIEIIFSIPGIGPLLVTATLQKDFPLLKGIVILNSAFFIFINMIADSIYKFIDPRL